MLINLIFNVIVHMQKSVRVFAGNYFEQDKVQKEMASTTVKYVTEAY